MSQERNRKQVISMMEKKQNDREQQNERPNTLEHHEAGKQLAVAIQRVHQMYQLQHYKEALLETFKLQKQYPEHPSIMSLTAMVYKRMAPDKALYWAAESLKRNISQPDAWRVRMSVYYDREDWMAFEAAARQLTIIAPNDPTPYLLLAQHQIRKGALEGALLLLERCISIEPLPIAYAAYSYALALLERIPESREAECKALEMNQKHAYTLMQLAWAAEQRGEHQHSFTFMEEAIRLNPDDRQLRREYMDALQKSHLWFRLCWWPSKQLYTLQPVALLMMWITFAILQPTVFLGLIALHVTTYWFSHFLVNWKIYGRPWMD